MKNQPHSKSLAFRILFFLVSTLFVLCNQKLQAQTPVLGTYPNTSIVSGNNVSIAPTGVFSNTVSMIAYTHTSFTGILTVNPVSHAVTVTDAKQAGAYTVTVQAFNGAATASTTFTLTVTNPDCGPGAFTSPPNVTILSIPYHVAIGDFDQDGFQDLAVAMPDANKVSIRMGVGGGSFAVGPDVSVGASPRWVAIGDLNGDGRDDLAVANTTGNSVSVRLALPGGGFALTTEISVGANPYCVVIGDFNNDGIKDLAAVCTDANMVYILKGNGSGGFTVFTQILVGAFPFAAAVGDFNNDGKQDLAVASGGGNSVLILSGDGLCNFSLALTIPTGTVCTNVQIGDFNGDGKQDLVATNQNSNNISILIANGSTGIISFSPGVQIAVGSQPWSSAVGDFNGDGKQDIVTAVYGGNVTELIGNGAGGFSATAPVTVTNHPLSVAVGDFNNDHKQDLAVATFGTNSVSIRMGTGVVPTVTTISSQCSYSWACNGQTYSTSGVYTCTHLVGNCLVVDTLYLGIIPGSLSMVSATACGSYTWACNNQTYTTSGIYDCLVGQCDTIRLNVTIHPIPGITVIPFSAACAGTPGGFTFLPVGGTAPFQVSVSPGFAIFTNITQSGLTGTPFSAGTYTITITDANGCTSSTVSTILAAPPVPVLTVTPIPLCMLGAFSLNTISGSAPYTYQITGPHTEVYPGIISGVSTDPVFPSGQYTIMVCDANGCCTSTTVTLMNVPPCALSGNLVVNTGYNPSIATALTSDGLTDPKWTVSSLVAHVSGGSYNQFATYNAAITTSDAAWAVYTSSHAISYANGASNSGGDVTFRRTFRTCLSDLITFNLCAAYDNGINGIRIDGVLVTNPGTINNSIAGSQFNTFHCYNFIRQLGPGLHTIDINVYNDDGPHGLNLYGSVSGSLNSIVTDVSPVNCCCPAMGLTLSAKVFLSGPYDASTGLMHDSLRVCGVIPFTEPYTAVPFNKPVINENNGETTTATVLSVAGPGAIVDWIFLELRNGAPTYDIVATKRVLLTRNGNIVDVDGISPVSFPQTAQGNYSVSVKHRNHLGVMTSSSVPLYIGSPVVDFTSGTVWAKPSLMPMPPGNSQRRLQGSNYTLWAGDAKNNKNVKYNGLFNDKEIILIAVGVNTPNNVLTCVYRREDVNMDNRVRYNGYMNDRLVIVDNILACPENTGHTSNYVIYQHTPD